MYIPISYIVVFSFRSFTIRVYCLFFSCRVPNSLIVLLLVIVVVLHTCMLPFIVQHLFFLSFLSFPTYPVLLVWLKVPSLSSNLYSSLQSFPLFESSQKNFFTGSLQVMFLNLGTPLCLSAASSYVQLLIVVSNNLSFYYQLVLWSSKISFIFLSLSIYFFFWLISLFFTLNKAVLFLLKPLTTSPSTSNLSFYGTQRPMLVLLFFQKSFCFLVLRPVKVALLILTLLCFSSQLRSNWLLPSFKSSNYMLRLFLM